MVRQAKLEDAAKLLEVLNTCYKETNFLNYGNGDFVMSIEQEEKWIEKQNNTRL